MARTRQEALIAENKPTMEAAKAKTHRARTFAIEAARLASSTHCRDVVVLDVSGLSPVTDYFVLATGTSPRQMRTVADDLRELGEQDDFRPLSTSGYEGDSWLLIDCIDVVCHVFSEQARLFYDLDGLWGDAPRVQWTDASEAGSEAARSDSADASDAATTGRASSSGE